MISHRKKFIYVHISKCGGCSIEEALMPYVEKFKKHQFMGPNKSHIPKPHKGALLNECKGPASNYFKFTFVRNPWDKLVSEYFFRGTLRDRRGPSFEKDQWKDNSFKDWVLGRKGYSFRSCMASHTSVQWLKNKKGKVAMDFIGRFESLQKDFNYVCNKINIEPVMLSHLNKNPNNWMSRKHYSFYYDNETLNFVNTYFKEDIKMFGYKFEIKEQTEELDEFPDDR